jgi:hypothetical protein
LRGSAIVFNPLQHLRKSAVSDIQAYENSLRIWHPP